MPEMKFLEINLTKDASLFLHATFPLLADFKENILCRGFNNPTKNLQNKKA
jgi:hypothetical protein